MKSIRPKTNPQVVHLIPIPLPMASGSPSAITFQLPNMDGQDAVTPTKTRKTKIFFKPKDDVLLLRLVVGMNPYNYELLPREKNGVWREITSTIRGAGINLGERTAKERTDKLMERFQTGDTKHRRSVGPEKEKDYADADSLLQQLSELQKEMEKISQAVNATEKKVKKPRDRDVAIGERIRRGAFAQSILQGNVTSDVTEFVNSLERRRTGEETEEEEEDHTGLPRSAPHRGHKRLKKGSSTLVPDDFVDIMRKSIAADAKRLELEQRKQSYREQELQFKKEELAMQKEKLELDRQKDMLVINLLQTFVERFSQG